jgi:HSP20 family protein
MADKNPAPGSTETATPTPAPTPTSIFGSPPFRNLQEEMDRMFHAFSMPQMSWRPGAGDSDGSLGLRVDIGDSDKEIRITADLPGVSEKDTIVTLEDNVLRIHAERKNVSEKSDTSWRIMERSQGVFERAIRVPGGIDPEKVEATIENGVLTVTLPKPLKAEASEHRIPISTK